MEHPTVALRMNRLPGIQGSIPVELFHQVRLGTHGELPARVWGDTLHAVREAARRV